ncbi:MAG: hypothetical protein AB7E95_08600 [Kiritimatiellales bacterium]
MGLNKDRRGFRSHVVVALCLTLFAVSVKGKVKPPFKVLYSDDTTNILTCESPFHQDGQSISMNMLDAVVDETAGTGIDVHMLQPGFTWVPFWQSKILPVEKHAEWWNKTYPDVGGVSGYLQMVLDGHDFVRQFVARCNQDGLVPFVSIRLNDKHLLNEIFDPKSTGRSVHISKYYIDHLDYRIGDDKNDTYQRVHNWAIPEVREYKYQFIKEICENYDIAGLELDFLRHPSFFRLYETSENERKQIMTDFVRRVRVLLDNTARNGKHRWLSVRVPQYLESCGILGVDYKGFEAAGVDIFNISGYYFTSQQGDIRQIAELIPDSAKYQELTHCAAIGQIVANGIDNFDFRRTTDEQFYTTAHLAYQAGFDGVSTFNFQYYRKHGVGDRGEFNEPPFHIFKHIGDKGWVAKQPQHYFIGKIWNEPRRTYIPLSQRLENGPEYLTFHIPMAPPTGGWTQDARMRFQADRAWSDQKLIVRFNNVNLKTIKDVSEPYPTPYKSGNGFPEQYRAYTIPKDILADGVNQLEIRCVGGDPLDLIYIDVAAQ